MSNAKAFLFWTGVSLAVHLALFALSAPLPTVHPATGAARKMVPVHLVAPRAAPSAQTTVPSALPPRSEAAPIPVSRPQGAPSPRPDRSPVPAPATASVAEPAPAPSSPPRPPAEPEAAQATVSPTPAAATAPPPGGEVPPRPAAEASIAAEGAEFTTETAAPRYERNPPPPYPRLAQARGWQGEVRLRVRVSVAGDVLAAAVETSSGYAVLDRAAREAVLRWSFRPGRRGGRAVESEVVVPVRYKLEDFKGRES